MEEKICTKCQKPWPLDQFYPGKKWKDRLHPWCKTCHNADSRARYERHCVEKPPRHRWNTGAVRHSYFSTLETPLQAYLLGLLAADGNILGSVSRISIELAIKDYELLELVRDTLAPKHLIRTRHREGSNRFGTTDSGTLSFTSDQMAKDLARFNIVPQKSAIIRWPKTLPLHLSHAYLLGFFDGDGNITWTINNGHRYPKWILTSGSIDFLQDVISVVKNHLNITIGGPYQRSNTRTSYLCTTGKKAYLLDAWLHQDNAGLSRKRLSL